MKKALNRLSRAQLINVAEAANINFAAINEREKVISDILYMAENGRADEIESAIKNQQAASA